MMFGVFNNKLCLLLTTSLLLTVFSGCSSKPEQSSEASTDTHDVKSDPPLEEFQSNLLKLAFDTATSIPVEPHIKTRSEWQQKVVGTWLKLEQPEQAVTHAEKIDNWRRGLCYAEAAFYYAQQGDQDNAHQILKLAGIEYEKGLQEWRIDQVKIAIAKVHMLLGEKSEVEKIESQLHESGTGAMDSARATKENEDSFEKQTEVLDSLIAAGSFEAVKNALYAYTELYRTFYGDFEKRKTIGDKIRSSWKPLPLFIRFELLNKLIEFSLEHNDPKNALEIIEESQELIDAHNWPLRYRISMQATLSLFRFKAGDGERAILQADSVLELFMKEGTNPSKIVNIYKAESLIPLAESYNGMGNRKKTLEVYKLALKSAVENPNSRPQAEDITDILCSMALHRVEPDEALKTEIANHIAQLGDPW